MAEKTAKSNKMKMYPFAFLQPYSVSEQVLNGLLKTCSRYFRKVFRVDTFKILSEKSIWIQTDTFFRCSQKKVLRLGYF